MRTKKRSSGIPSSVPKLQNRTALFHRHPGRRQLHYPKAVINFLPCVCSAAPECRRRFPAEEPAARATAAAAAPEPLPRVISRACNIFNFLYVEQQSDPRQRSRRAAGEGRSRAARRPELMQAAQCVADEYDKTQVLPAEAAALQR
jgi:hypothetical protein